MEHLKSEFCFVCNIETKKYYKRFCEIIIKGTGTRLGNLIERFFNEVGSKRRVNDEFNVLCFDCIGRIQSYDQMVLFVKNSEKELRNIISKTEIDLLNKSIESDEYENMENNSSPDDWISDGNSSIDNKKLIRNGLTIKKPQPKDKVLDGSIPKVIESERSNSINTMMNKEISKTVGFCRIRIPESEKEKIYCYEKGAYICKKCGGHFKTKKLFLVSALLFY